MYEFDTLYKTMTNLRLVNYNDNDRYDRQMRRKNKKGYAFSPGPGF